MAIDVKTNPQYISVQQDYQQKLDNLQRIADAQDDWNHLQGGELTPEQIQQKQRDSDLLWQLDPDCSLRNMLGSDPKAGVESVRGELMQQEADALRQITILLQGADALKEAEAAAAAATKGLNADQDMMTRVMAVFAMLGQANETVTSGHMDNISGNVDKITQLNTLQQNVRNRRPEGSDANKTNEISADVVNKLRELGVEVPNNWKLNDDGKTYSISQSSYDTLINNIQSQQSSLTTLNQNKTIDLNKSIDVGQQCTTFRSTFLTKWSELMQKLSNG